VAGATSRAWRERLDNAGARNIAVTAVELVLVLVLVIELGALVAMYVSTGNRFAVMDSRYFYELATRLANGELPYRDFPFEYPPLAIVPLILPQLVLAFIGGQAVRYAWLLVAENVALVLATAGCLVLLARRGWSAASTNRTVLGYLLLTVATPVLFWRFDAFPTLLMMAGLVLFASGRRASSGVTLGAGVAAKLFPGAVVPVLLAADLFKRDWAKAFWLVAGVLASVALVGVLFLVGTGTRELSFLEYHADRGVQLESLLASIGMAGQLLGAPAGRVFNGFGAWQIDSPLLAALPWLGDVIAALLIGALVVSTVLRFRADVAANGEVMPHTLAKQLLATLFVVVLAYRVLSPQFLVWLLPLAALRPRPEFWTIFVICLLTLAIYPLNYDALIRLQPEVALLLIVRNLLMVGTCVWLIGSEAVTGRSRSRAKEMVAPTA
jgi:Glycosyltransferase family 87